MRFNNFPPGVAAKIDEPVAAVTYIGHDGSTTSPGNPTNLNGFSIGPAATNRQVVLLLHYKVTSGVASGMLVFALDGISADHYIHSADGDRGCAIGVWDKPTGTTASIYLYFVNSNVDHYEVGGYRVNKAGIVRVQDSASNSTSDASTPVTCDAYSLPGGAAVGAVTGVWSMSTPTLTDAAVDYADNISGDGDTQGFGLSGDTTTRGTKTLSATRASGGSAAVVLFTFR